MAGANPSFSTYPDFVHEEQQHIIGEEHTNNQGDLFDYVEFMPGSYKKGIVVVDTKSTDLIGNSGVGTVTSAAQEGSIYLKDTGEFANKDLRGAIGTIFDGPGIGQSFFVKSVIDANTIEIQLLKKAGRGWETALSTASKYKLTLPGRVQAGASAGNRPRGVITYDDFTVPAGEFRYGFVRKSGIDDGLIDVSGGVDLTENEAVKATTNGLIDGVVASATAVGGLRAELKIAINDIIGRSLTGNPGGSTDVLAPIEFLIENNRRSLRRARKREDPEISVK